MSVCTPGVWAASPVCPHVSLLSLHTGSLSPYPHVSTACPIYVAVYTSDPVCLCTSAYVPCLHPPWAALAVCLVSQQVSAGTELEDTAARGQEDAKAPDMSSLKTLGLPQPDFHSLILDLSSLSFVDTVCLKSLKNVRGWGHP